VIAVAPASFPRTTSGKIRRALLRRKLEEGEFGRLTLAGWGGGFELTNVASKIGL
jgi:acyl-CoA synthetase (AMP-forming)/AMP-acid ligase II